jgi:glycosyltransferase involved in cell wall biosynthesis
VSRLRVAFVHEQYPPYRHELFGLLAARHEVEFFFVNEPEPELPPHSHSVRGYRLPEMSDFVLAPGLTRAVLRAHRVKPFDLILGSDLGSFATLAAYRLSCRVRRPFVLWSGEWVATRHPRRWLTRPLEARVARKAAAGLAYGTRAAAYLEQLGAARESIFLTGNTAGYAFERANDALVARVRSEWGIGDRPIILFLGRLIPVKAPEILVQAFAGVAARHPSLFLVVAGEGPMLAQLEAQSENLRLKSIHFTRHAVEGKDEKNLLYSLADVFVLPSRRTRIAEAWGLVLNEAASAGLPIVVSETVGAVGDLIRPGESGLVVPEADARALEEAIEQLLADRGRAKRLGENARRSAAAFTPERMADAFDRAFERAAGRIR